MKYRLFGNMADRYDWHTPPRHYQHDHAFVLSRLPPKPCRILDLGCGTGVFLEKAIDGGYDAIGLDASPEMVAIAAQRTSPERVRVERMQDLDEIDRYAAIVSLCWSFNYVRSFAEAEDVLSRCFTALHSGGLLILQIAHAPNAMGALNEDREPGPDGQPDDVVFFYRFHRPPHRTSELRAQYVYAGKSRNELIAEEHRLAAADARKMSQRAKVVGFQRVELLDSWKGEPLTQSFNAFLVARRP